MAQTQSLARLDARIMGIQRLSKCKRRHGDFNCVELQLNAQDIDELEDAILTMSMPESNGFFWGSDSFFWTDEDGNDYPENSYYYLEQDLEFVTEARKMLDKGYRVFYSCWY